MKKTVIYVILLIAVAIAAVLSVIALLRKSPAAAPEVSAPPTAPAVSETTDAPALPTPTETPVPTEAPVFETRAPLETETPEETPAPEETVPPAPEDLSGSFNSDTGTGLNLTVDWRTFADGDGSRRLRVEVSAVSYSFYTSSLYQSIVLTVDGVSYTADSPELSYDGSELAISPMAVFTVDAPDAGTAVTVVWHYRGSYSGVALEEITASGLIA